MHIHVIHEKGEAKFWIDPDINLADNHGLTDKQISEIIKILKAKKEDIKNDWRKHFGN